MTESASSPGDHRIAHIELDEETIIWRNADIEQERRIAIFDLIEENSFKPLRAERQGSVTDAQRRADAARRAALAKRNRAKNRRVEFIFSRRAKPETKDE